MSFERVANKLQDPDYIIDHPKDAKLYDDKDLDLIYITVSSLALRANKTNFANIMTYSDRLKKEYGILMVKDIINRDKTLINTKTFSQWADRNKDVLFF
jgi:hypoxanthine-guanine phosphoribosyltransferase